MEDKMAPVRAARKKPLSAWAESKYREVYISLIEAGWSSSSLEQYALYRFKERIPASTFRNHMVRIEKKAGTRITAGKLKGTNGDALNEQIIDVKGVRQQLVKLQSERIAIAIKRENDTQTLNPDTRLELTFFSKLLNEVKEDQVDFGERAAPGVEETALPEPSRAPRHQTFGEMVGLGEGVDELAAVEALAQVIPMHRAG